MDQHRFHVLHVLTRPLAFLLLLRFEALSRALNADAFGPSQLLREVAGTKSSSSFIVGRADTAGFTANFFVFLRWTWNGAEVTEDIWGCIAEARAPEQDHSDGILQWALSRSLG